MPMIGQGTSTDYPAPTEEVLKSFFYHRIRETSRGGTFASLHPPAVTSIRFRGSYGTDKILRYKIGIPWHIFGARLYFGRGIQLVAAFLFFLNRKPESQDEKACINILPNTYAPARLCYGKHRPWAKSRVDRYIAALYRNYWLGVFTKDLAPHISSVPAQLRWSDEVQDRGSNLEICQYYLAKWEEETKKGTNLIWVEVEKGRSIEDVCTNSY